MGCKADKTHMLLMPCSISRSITTAGLLAAFQGSRLLSVPHIDMPSHDVSVLQRVIFEKSHCKLGKFGMAVAQLTVSADPLYCAACRLL